MTATAIIAAATTLSLVAFAASIAASYRRGYESGFNAALVDSQAASIKQQESEIKSLEGALNEASEIDSDIVGGVDLVGGLLSSREASEEGEGYSDASRG